MIRNLPRRGILLPMLLAGMLLTGEAHAQRQYLFDHLTVGQGLSQGAVNCILQDGQGFIWLGTQDGLNRFDGYVCRIFKHDPADPKTLNDGFVISLAETPDGTLWVGTYNAPGKLNRYNPASETFTEVPADSVDLSRARKSVYQPPALDEPSGVRWRGSHSAGLTRFDPASGQTTVYRHDNAKPGSLSDDRVYSILRDHLGTIWIGTRGGLDRFEPAAGSFTHFRHNPADPRSLSDDYVWPLLEDRSGNIWVGTYGGGLNLLDRASGTFTRFLHEEGNSRSLADNRIYSLYQDRSGLIWVGTGEHGVDRFQPELAAFLHFKKDPSNPASLLDNNVLGMYFDHSGAAWIGTRAGTERFDPAAGRFTHFRHDPRNPRTIGGDLAQCFLEDHEGSLWIGLSTDGLDRLDRSRTTFTHFRQDPADPRTLSDNRVYALYEDRAGVLWVGTYRTGLNRFDRSTGTFIRYVHADSLPGSLGGQGVFAILEDHEGTFWVGTLGGGLDSLDRRTGIFTHFRNNEKDPKSLSDNIVTCLFEDSRGTLWVGTTGGLNHLDKKTGTFKSFHEKDGLANDQIFGIAEDAHGRLWMSTNKGLSRFDLAHETFRNYYEGDGLQGNEFNQNAFARDPASGRIIAGGGNGFTMFHPDSVRDNGYVPPVVFSAFTRYNTDDKEGKPIEEPGIARRQEMTISYKDNVATFEFAALSFFHNANNQYAYKLEGYSPTWIQLGTNRRATFTNLDGGDYTLRVRAANNDGLWNEEGAAMRLVVIPPWWKTRWAYGSYVILTLSVLYGLRRFEVKRREQKAMIVESDLRAKAAEAEARALEAENERKTKELEDARRLQLSMLPQEVPTLPGYEIAVFMKTATEVGGDYYDFSRAADGTLNVAFGDATGHGMQAGTIVTLMKGLFLSDAARFDIQPFFNHCSGAIKGLRLARHLMAFTLLRLKDDTLSFSSAGMPPVFFYRGEAFDTEEVLVEGMPLGAMKKYPYGLHARALAPGDTVLLLTDGLPEQKNTAGEMLGYQRVKTAFTESAACPPAEIITRLTRLGEEWMTGAVQEDDITLLVIRKTTTQERS